MMTSGMLRRVALVRTDVSEELTPPPKRQFLQEAHGVTSQKAAFFIWTGVKTSNLYKFSIVSYDSQIITMVPTREY
jgi:hypothetical protein